MAVKIQHLRSSTADKRPTAAALLDGEIALNTNAGAPGAFFEDAGGSIIKIGPAEVGSAAPNATPASGGSAGNTAGEFWYDTSNTGGNSQDALKIYTGATWAYIGQVTIGSTNIEVGAAATTSLTGVTTIDITSSLDLENQADLRFYEATASGTNYVGFQAPASITTDLLWTLPSADGSAGQFLSTNGSGTLSWGSVSTNSISQGDSSVTVTDTGSDGTITFRTDGTDRWKIDNNGDLLPIADSTYDIGALGTEVLNVHADNLYGTLQTASQTNITGVGTLTAGTWNASIIGVAYGGTGLDGSAAANGTLLIGNGSGYTLTTLTEGEGIDITNASGSITIAGEDATSGVGSGNKGIASFESSDFSVASGHVTLDGSVVQSIAGDSGTATPTGSSFTISGGTALTSSATSSTVTINLDNTAVTAAGYGAADTVATFTVDQQGRLTAAADVTISILHTQVSDFDTGVQSNRLDQMAAPTAAVSFNSQNITNLADPSNAQDAATKNYVDQVAQGLDVKASCLAATTGSITLSGAQTIDGVSVTTGDRVLVKNQGTASQNGIYVADTGAWSRSSDADTWDELVSAFVFVEEGASNADNGYVCTVDAGGTLGVTAVTWEQFSGAGQITAGNGLSKTGNTLDVNVDGTTTEINGSDQVAIHASYVGQSSITTLGTITTGTWNGSIIGTSYGGTGVDNSSISQNYAFLGPNSGGAGAPSWREILTSDIAPVTGGSFDAGTY